MPTKETIQNAIDEALVHYWELFDETTVTEDWLREQGFENTGPSIWEQEPLSVHGDVLQFCDGAIIVDVIHNPTRGDVLRLLSVVGRGE